MVRGDGKDKGPSSGGKVSEQDGADATDEESDSSYVSADDTLAIQIEMDRSWTTSAPASPDVRASDYDDYDDNDDETDEEEPPNSRASSHSHLTARRVHRYRSFEHAHHVSSLSLMRTTQRSSSLRSHTGSLNPRLLRMSTLSSTPIPSPSIRSSSSHPDVSSLCKHWESTGPANVTLTYTPSGTTISASSSKSKGRKRSPTFHHT